MSNILIVGAGIGGLSAAIALGRAGLGASLIEQSSELTEVGAGVQLGPNVTRLLKQWDVLKDLQDYAFEPASLDVHCALNGELLAKLNLGSSFAARYSAPYLTAHRADLHSCLYANVLRTGVADIKLSHNLIEAQTMDQGIEVGVRVGAVNEGATRKGELTVDSGVTNAGNQTLSREMYCALIGADGIWSRVREILFDTEPLNDSTPNHKGQSSLTKSKFTQFSGDYAYRSLVLQKMLPQHLRVDTVKVWLGPGMHLVQYPVRGGDWLNSVLILNSMHKAISIGNARTLISGVGDPSALNWNINISQHEKALSIQAVFTQTCSRIQDTLRAVDSWSVWPLMKTDPLSHLGQMAKGRVALLGDAAHPMLPYLAQGAGMAIEDAFELGEQFKAGDNKDGQVPENVFLKYASKRWSRNAKVQKRALLNAEIFHATGAFSWARDKSLKLLGPRLLDLPWLYGYRS